MGIVEKKDFNVMKAMKEFLDRNTKGKAGGVLFFLCVVKEQSGEGRKVAELKKNRGKRITRR